MSFLTGRALTTGARAAVAGPKTGAARAFTASALRRKTATETVKDTLKTVNRAVSDKLVDGIELGESATQKAKDVSGMSAAEAKAKVSEAKGAAHGKAEQLSGEAKGKASEVTGKAKGAAAEVKGKM